MLISYNGLGQFLNIVHAIKFKIACPHLCLLDNANSESAMLTKIRMGVSPCNDKILTK